MEERCKLPQRAAVSELFLTFLVDNKMISDFRKWAISANNNRSFCYLVENSSNICCHDACHERETDDRMQLVFKIIINHNDDNNYNITFTNYILLENTEYIKC